MKKLLLINICLLLCSGLFAQTLSKTIFKADSLYEFGEYEASAKQYALELQSENTIPLQTILYCQTQYALCKIRTNNLESAQAAIDKAMSKCTEGLIKEKALLLDAQAQVYYQKGQVEQADTKISSAIDLLLKDGQKSSAEISECYNTQGLIEWINGNNEKALEYLSEALAIRKNIFGQKSSKVAALYNNIGLVYSGIDESKAANYYEDALEIYKAAYPANHPTLAIAYSNLGQIYRKQKVFNTSLAEYAKALAIWEAIYPGLGHPNKAFVYSSIAQVYEDKKEFGPALQNATSALAIYRQAYGEKHPNTAACYTMLGSIYSDKGDYSAALFNFQQALISNCNTFSNTDYQVNPGVKEYYDGQLLLSTLSHKAITLHKREAEKTLRLKDLTLALSTYQSCDTLIDRLRQTRTGKNDKIALGTYSYQVYDGSVELCLILSQNTTQKRKYLELAYYFMERSKATVLQESIAESKAKNFAGIPDVEIKKEDQFKTTIAYLEQKMAKGISDETTMKTVSSQLFDAKRNYEAFVTSLEKNYPSYYNLKYNIQPITIISIQKKLQQKDCLLEYMVSDQMNAIHVARITKKDFKIYSMPIGETYEKYIAGMRNSIKFDNKNTFIKTSVSLHKQLIPKISHDIDHLIVIPDGKMSAIPFEALLTIAPSNDTVSYTQMDFLINTYAVSYNYAGSLYEQTISKSETNKKTLLFAPVDFSVSSDLNSLPGTLEEIQSLKKIFQAYTSADTYTYTAASKSVLTSDSIRSYSIIHLATHGVVDEEQPELSCIYTSGTTEENDRIYSGDMYNMHLNADLVALSACQTGLGKIAKGEGMIGLSRALFYAGADNIMVSLWKVSDQSTQVFMQNFYTNIDSTKSPSFAYACREAKIKLLRSAEFNHPYHWSAFILIGK